MKALTQRFLVAVILLTLCFAFLSNIHAMDVLSDWDAFDQLVEIEVTQRPDIIMPPSFFQLSYTLGLRCFDPQEFPDLATILPTKHVGEVPLWQLRILETNGWFITSVDDTVIHANMAATYDTTAWVHTQYGAPPTWIMLDSILLSEWYFLRRRERVVMDISLVPAPEWDNYLATLEAAYTGASLPDKKLPVLPTDSNRVAFARLVSPTLNTLGFDLYTPGDLPVDIFTKTDLRTGSRWSYTGTVQAVAPFTPASVTKKHPGLFLCAARGDIDSDGDGIPDGMELLHFGTNPLLWDSSGDGLSDWRKIYQYGLDPLSRDSDGDGYSDDEELLAGTDPTQITPGATARALRYYRDLDDRVTAIYVGADGAAATATVTPAGNSTTLQERSTP